MTIDQIVTAGGTGGLIALLIYVMNRFAEGKWRPEKDIAAADARTEKALAAGERALATSEKVVEEMQEWRLMVEQLLSQRTEPPT